MIKLKWNTWIKCNLCGCQTVLIHGQEHPPEDAITEAKSKAEKQGWVNPLSTAYICPNCIRRIDQAREDIKND